MSHDGSEAGLRVLARAAKNLWVGAFECSKDYMNTNANDRKLLEAVAAVSDCLEAYDAEPAVLQRLERQSSDFRCFIRVLRGLVGHIVREADWGWVQTVGRGMQAERRLAAFRLDVQLPLLRAILGFDVRVTEEGKSLDNEGRQLVRLAEMVVNEPESLAVGVVTENALIDLKSRVGLWATAPIYSDMPLCEVFDPLNRDGRLTLLREAIEGLELWMGARGIETEDEGDDDLPREPQQKPIVPDSASNVAEEDEPVVANSVTSSVAEVIQPKVRLLKADRGGVRNSKRRAGGESGKQPGRPRSKYWQEEINFFGWYREEKKRLGRNFNKEMAIETATRKFPHLKHELRSKKGFDNLRRRNKSRFDRGWMRTNETKARERVLSEAVKTA